ncbi:MAG: hypothetical protein ACM37W_17435 [Actinomycetota bacterium]
MGLISWLFGAPVKGGGSGSHSINKSAAMAPSPGNPYSPQNPGNFQSLTTAPTVPSPRYFSEEEAAALKQLAAEKKAGVRHSKSAYKSLASLDKSDADLVGLHYNYAGANANQEAKKVKAKAKFAALLHGLRTGYANAEASIDHADMKASAKIAEIKQKLQQPIQ